MGVGGWPCSFSWSCRCSINLDFQDSTIIYEQGEVIDTVLAPDCRNNEDSGYRTLLSGDCTAGDGNLEPMAGPSGVQEELDNGLEELELHLSDETQLDEASGPKPNIDSSMGDDECSEDNDSDDGVDSDFDCGSGEEDGDLSLDELDMEETYGGVDPDQDLFSYN